MIIKIVTLPVGQLRTNCYLAICQKTKNCLIIDPGDEANFISEKILREGLKPIAIIATHGHFDHILATNELKMSFKAPFLANQNDENIINHMTQSASWWLKRKIIESPPTIDQYLKEGDSISFGKGGLRVIETPGHTPGGVSFYNESSKVLFSGDIIFKSGLGRTDFSYSSLSDLKNSIKKIRQRFSGFILYPGHGPEFFL